MRIGFVTLTIGALSLGYMGLHEYLSGRPEYGTAVLDLAYWDLQLFVLDSAPLQTGGELPLTLQIARFAAPAATLSALFATARALMESQIILLRARYARKHTIICGGGPASIFLARQLVAQERRVVMIDPDVGPDVAPPGLPRQVLRLPGDPRVGSVLRAAGVRRAREVMALTPDSAFNGEVAVTVRASDDLAERRLLCYAEVADPELCAELAARALGAGRSSTLQVVFFSRHDRAARRLLDRYPLTSVGQTSGEPVAVVVVGDGQLKDALVNELRRRWTPTTGASSTSLSLLIKSTGEIFGIQAPTDLHVEAVDQVHRTPSHVFICADDDATAIRAGLKVSRTLRSDVELLVVATPVSTVFGRELATVALADTRVERGVEARDGSRQLVLHNVMETVYSPEAVRRGDIEDIARAAHDAYVAACQDHGDTQETNPSMVPWEDLPEFKKADNRDQAADIGRKLAAVGATLVPASGHEEPFAFHDDEVDLLAHMEHDRWLRRRREHGWSYAPDRDEDTRKHPDMVSWEELSAQSKDKDRSAVCKIPDLIRAAGLAIVRGVV